jgi:putative membrane protein
MSNKTKTIKKLIVASIGIVSASALVCLPGIAQNRQETMSPSSGSMSGSMSSVSKLDRDFMTKAAQSDMTEIQTSQLALQKSQNREIRDYAQKMIQQHTNSSKELMQIAQSKGVTLPKDVGSKNQPLVSKLSKLSGQEFDRAYMQGQIQSHQKTLNEYQAYLQKGQQQELIAFANKIAPLVSQHLEMAQGMVAQR